MDPAPAPTCPRRWEKWYLSPPWGGGYWVSVRCCGVPPPLPPPASVTPRPRAHGCRGAAPPGGGGSGGAGPPPGRGGWRWEKPPSAGRGGSGSRAPQPKSTQPSLFPGSVRRRAPQCLGPVQVGCYPPPPSLSLPHTCAPTWVFPPGLLWEQPGVGSIPFPQGAGAVAGPRLGLAPFQAPSRHLELGDTGMLGARFTPLQGLEHPRHRWREK